MKNLLLIVCLCSLAAGPTTAPNTAAPPCPSYSERYAIVSQQNIFLRDRTKPPTTNGSNGGSTATTQECRERRRNRMSCAGSSWRRGRIARTSRISRPARSSALRRRVGRAGEGQQHRNRRDRVRPADGDGRAVRIDLGADLTGKSISSENGITASDPSATQPVMPDVAGAQSQRSESHDGTKAQASPRCRSSVNSGGDRTERTHDPSPTRLHRRSHRCPGGPVAGTRAERDYSESATQPAQNGPTSRVVTTKGGGLMLNFKDASIDSVLDELSAVAGFIVVKETQARGPRHAGQQAAGHARRRDLAAQHRPEERRLRRHPAGPDPQDRHARRRQAARTFPSAAAPTRPRSSRPTS